MSLTAKSPVSNKSSKKEPTLSDVIKILKSQESKLVTISTKLSMHENKTDSIMVKLDELTLDISNLRKENNELKSQIDTLQLRINSLETSMCNNGTNPDMKFLVHEVQERITKSKNILIFNAAEEPNNSELSPAKLTEIIFKKIDLNIPIVHAIRLGKNSEKPRPIMVKLGSKSEVLSVLKAKRKLREIDSLKHIFTGYYQNVRSLNNKLKFLTCNVPYNNYDFIIFTETWLNAEVLDSELDIFNYNIFRCDRSGLTSKCDRGGGVLIGIHRKYISELITTPYNSVEQVFVSIKNNNKIKLIIGTCYIPEVSPLSVYETHVNTVNWLYENFGDNVDLIICGDYNFRGTTFSYDNTGLIVNGRMPTAVNVVFDAFSIFNMSQFNSLCNPYGNTLDLVFSNLDLLSVDLCTSPLVPIDKPHPPLLINFEFKDTKNQSELPLIKKNFIKADFVGISMALNNINWDDVFSNGNVDTYVEDFYNIVNTILEKKRFAHKQYKISPNSSNYSHFSELRAKCKYFSKQCHEQYLNNIQNNLITNPKKFWSFIEERSKINFIPSPMSYENSSYDNNQAISNAFANYFSSVYASSLSDSTYDTTNVLTESLINTSSLYIPLSEIFEGLSNMGEDCTSGPDKLPPIVLSKCCYALARPIHILFNMSLSNGIFPQLWKSSFVIPIFKSGNRNLIQNYRPISKLSSIPKLFEKLIEPKLSYMFNSVIIDEQHGFRTKKSTCTNLLVYVTNLYDIIEKKGQVDTIYTDLSKAFDSVDHKLLLIKLNALGIDKPLLTWFGSFLTGRTQQIKILNQVSSTFSVSSGVPQGGHLSPLLFLLFINDLKSVFHFCKYSLFADDLKMYMVVNSLEDCRKLQNDINRFNKWCKDNHLSININKCAQISFTRSKNPVIYNYSIDDQDLNIVSSIKDLGIILSADLSFSEHISFIYGKAMRMLGFIRRQCYDFKNIDCLKTLYCTMVRPILEYGTIIWNSYQLNQINRLNNVQSYFLRYLSYKFLMNCSTKEIAMRLGLHSLSSRRKFNDASFIHKILNNNINCPEMLKKISLSIPTCNTRSKTVFYESFHCQSYSFNQPKSRMIRVCNSLDSFDFNFDSESKLRHLCLGFDT
ncbi:uncharacterized protein LOC126900110 [Daktulosphaira vitifoliae]|uniref:uncharacterized protein LOC126900110 n=1 Tax=Daktulosphaira vitifoliae TaxID=58002 RepID=UPI0021AA9FC1|nr:uncharacterized protein LOC126900110 [Daktulosphaira vitifoliae]